MGQLQCLPRTRRSLLALSILMAAATVLPSQDSASKPATDAMAHSLLQVSLQGNGLATAQEPWRLRATFRIHPPGDSHPIFGTFEEWHAAPDRWRRTYSSVESGLNGTEWSVGPGQRFLARRGADSLDRIRLELRIARPLTDPLERAAAILPSDPLELKIVTAGGLTLNCISVIRTPQDSFAPYPTMCFDRADRLRLLSTLDTAVEFDNFVVFHHRAIARTVKVLVKGALFAEIDVTSLDPLPTDELYLLTPFRNAMAEPLLLEPGARAPASLFESAAHPPLQPDGYPYRGTALLLLVVGRDGRAHLEPGLSVAPSSAILDSIEIAVRRWQFKPYLVDGQPAPVALVAPYTLDGRPFAAMFQQPHALDASEFEDYLEGGGATEGFQGGAPRARRGRR